jgi:tRNA1(Val) A37 N6-methylase TrmN6
MICYNQDKKHYKVKSYKPFSKNTEFICYINKYRDIKKLKNVKLGYSIIIKPNGYVPKTGILLCRYLNQIPTLSSLKILDIGTGESALLAIHSAFLGSDEVTAIDIDKIATKWAKKNVSINKLDNKITVKKVSLYEYKSKSKFDIIISNPPQMPVKENISMHDDGGKDGKIHIEQIIKLAAKNLKKNGILIFSAFDFLGVDKRYNKESSIFDTLIKYSFYPKIVTIIGREIKPTSYTSKNLSYIKKKYYKYNFYKNKRGLYQYKIFIIHSVKTNHKINLKTWKKTQQK